jgi:hypothetical protein
MFQSIDRKERKYIFMIKKKYKKLVIDIGLGTVLSTVMPLVALLSAGHFAWEAFFQGFLVAFTTGFTIIEMMPVLHWSEKYSASISNRAIQYVVKNIITALFIALFVGGISVFVEHGFAAFPGFFASYPKMVFVIFVIFFIWPPILVNWVEKYTEP